MGIKLKAGKLKAEIEQAMKKQPIADGQHYFGSSGYPITVRQVVTAHQHEPSHPHDLTEIEHEHDFCELAIITNGRGMHHLEGTDFPITAGDVFLLQGHQRHFFHERKQLELYNIMYDPSLLQLPENELRLIPGYCAMFLLEPTYRRHHRFASRLHLKRMALAHALQIVSRMNEEVQRHAPGMEAALRAQLLELIVFLSRAYTTSDATEAHALLRVGDVIGALERDYSQPWTISSLLEVVHMSRSHFMRVFRKATGQTPIEYLVRLRLQKSMELLQQTEMSVTDIAMEVGFNDSNYFSRQFKSANGISPSQYRTTQSAGSKTEMGRAEI